VKIVSPSFFQLQTETLARLLLGKKLIYETTEGLCSGIIVETEAYLNENDPACHASRGKTKRNAVMFGPPGRAYVYFIYGNHFCFNVVSGKEGKGEAVLIRALQPVDGIPIMKRRRATTELVSLTNGPGKLCQAMGITIDDNGRKLDQKPLYIAEHMHIEPAEIVSTTRIGISQAKEKLLRFYLRNNHFVSRK
jgi:DNA-3-methyladenine glycosylase